MNRELNTLTAHELLDELKAKRVSSDDIAASLKKRIENIDASVNAYVRKGKGISLGCKKEGSTKVIPVSIKDNICTEGYNTECCSKILSGFVPPYDATVITKIKECGHAYLSLKTNMDEFAFGSSTENSYFGPTHNP